MPLASEALSPNQLSDTAGRQARGSGSTTSRFTFKNLQVLENIIFIKLTSVTHYELEMHIQIKIENSYSIISLRKNIIILHLLYHIWSKFFKIVILPKTCHFFFKFKH